MKDAAEWRVWVDGRRVRQRWTSVEAAQAQVDAVILKLITVTAWERDARPSIKALSTMCVLATIARDKDQAGRLGVKVDGGRYRFVNEVEAKHA